MAEESIDSSASAVDLHSFEEMRQLLVPKVEWLAELAERSPLCAISGKMYASLLDQLLKSLHRGEEELKRLSSEMRTRETQLQQRENAVSARSEEVRQEEAALDAQQKDWKQVFSETNEYEKVLNAREDDICRRENSLNEGNKDLVSRERQLLKDEKAFRKDREHFLTTFIDARHTEGAQVLQKCDALSESLQQLGMTAAQHSDGMGGIMKNLRGLSTTLDGISHAQEQTLAQGSERATVFTEEFQTLTTKVSEDHKVVAKSIADSHGVTAGLATQLQAIKTSLGQIRAAEKQEHQDFLDAIIAAAERDMATLSEISEHNKQTDQIVLQLPTQMSDILRETKDQTEVLRRIEPACQKAGQESPAVANILQELQALVSRDGSTDDARARQLLHSVGEVKALVERSIAQVDRSAVQVVTRQCKTPLVSSHDEIVHLKEQVRELQTERTRLQAEVESQKTERFSQPSCTIPSIAPPLRRPLFPLKQRLSSDTKQRTPWQSLTDQLASDLSKLKPVMEANLSVVDAAEQLATLYAREVSAIRIKEFLESAERDRWYCLDSVAKYGFGHPQTEIGPSGICNWHDECFQVKRPRQDDTVGNIVCRRMMRDPGSRKRPIRTVAI